MSWLDDWKFTPTFDVKNGIFNESDYKFDGIHTLFIFIFYI